MIRQVYGYLNPELDRNTHAEGIWKSCREILSFLSITVRGSDHYVQYNEKY